MTLFADLVFPLPLAHSFRYIVPPNLAAAALTGKRALAPLGGKTLAGFIVAVDDKAPGESIVLKEIQEIVDPEPVVSPRAVDFTRRLSAHFGSSWGELLAACLPPSREIRTSTKVVLTEQGRAALKDGSLSPEEKKAADVLGPNAYTLLHIRRKSGLKNPASVVSRMRKKGLLEVRERAVPPVRKARPLPPASPAQLELDFSVGPALRAALVAAGAALEQGRFSPWLLFGDPEARLAACLQLIPRVLARSRQVLVLVPEISRAEPLREALEKKLGESAAVLHGQQPDALREAEWRRVRSGEARIVVGPRSALFAPAENLGLVVVEDESDESHVQSESPAYDARRAAWMAAEDRGALLVLGSDAPTVEAFHRAREGGYLISLPRSGIKRPAELVDDRGERGLIARRVMERLRESLGQGRTGLVFANRRGFASFLVCPRCGHVPRCERCEIALTYFKKDERLVCRYCGASRPRMKACPECGGRVMEPRGAGVEAIEDELRKALPAARIASFDSDRVRTRAAREKAAASWAAGGIDLLVGTEMLAHQDIPGAGCVAVLNPEVRLAHPDFRSAQRTFRSLLRMVRLAAPDGDVLVQTSAPDHHAVREAARRDYEAFFDVEIGFRRLMSYPPFSSMAEIVLPGRDLRPVARKARDLVRLAREFGNGLEAMGPGLAPPSAVKGGKGLQIILKAERPDVLDAGLDLVLRAIQGRRSVTRFD
jgi:primosomal protein N' (replication factor Y)